MTIAPDYVRMMAAYNAEMNRRLYAAAARLSEAERRLDHGAFWGSIHGTFAHLLWGDRQWMSRFDGWEKNPGPLALGGNDPRDLAALTKERTEFDAKIEKWAARVAPDWLAGDLTWHSDAAKREMTAPLVHARRPLLQPPDPPPRSGPRHAHRRWAEDRRHRSHADRLVHANRHRSPHRT